MKSIICLAVLSAALTLSATAQTDPPWQVAGRQGIVLQVIVPVALAGEEAAYRAQIERLCAPAQSCFINFFSNSTGAGVEMPLPDAIGNEPTATFRRSVKHGGEFLRWSCRMQKAVPDCF